MPLPAAGVVGVNGRFDGDARGLRDSLATAVMAGTTNEAGAVDSYTGVYEGSRGWSSSLAKPEAVESLMQLERGEWSVRQPAEGVYQFGSERFLKDFEPVDGLRSSREALLGPYNYVGDAGSDLVILLEADDVRSWFVDDVEPVAHVEYGSQADLWGTAPSGDIALRAPEDGVDLYRLKLPGAGAFVVLGEELPGVVLYPPSQSQS